MAKTDRSVVRNEAYRREKVGNMERHNERKNEHYGNGDVDVSRSALNIHFKECENGYLQAFDQMIADGIISTRGLQQNAKIVDELIFDVNTEYFERNGGYDYAKAFFEEAYRLAVKEAGGEQYILSAVMHADERNKALSEQLGRDVYHYHLHVVYVPVVRKEVLWTKRCKDPALVGTVKEVITQVSHSKKWAFQKVADENGKKRLVYSYSLLQDRYFEHMKQAGFIGFERGERGSTAEHLDVLDYKIQQDEKRLGVLDEVLSSKEKQAEKLDLAVEKKQERLSGPNEKIAVKKKVSATIFEIENMPRKTLLGKMELTPDNWETVSSMAVETISLREDNKRLKEEVKIAKSAFQKQKEAYVQLVQQVQPYLDAVKLFPQQVKRALESVMRLGLKRQKPEVSAPVKNHERKRSSGIEL